MTPQIEKIVQNHHGDTLGFSRHYLTLYSIVLGIEAKEVFEFGCGFSTPTILKALEQTGGHLTTCDMRPIEKTGNNPSLLEEYRETWTYLQGDSLETVPPAISGKIFDFVLHDGSHEWRVVYKDLRKILPHIKHNGILLVHDTEHIPTYRLKLSVRLALLGYRHEILTLPYGHGLTIIRILGNKKNGSISTTWEKERKTRNESI